MVPSIEQAKPSCDKQWRNSGLLLGLGMEILS
jgi:hypothetical protein